MNTQQIFKKLLLTFIMFASFAVFSPKRLQAQITETFESATVGLATFTTGGKTFNLTNSLGTNAPLGFKVFDLSGTGYSSSSQYIHSENNGVTFGQIGTVKAAAGTFKLNNLWIFLTGDAGQNPGATNGGAAGSVTFRGKLAGVPQFIVVQTTTGANIGYGGQGNGFIQSNFASLGGTDNTNVTIDELEIELSNNYSYFAIDNFTFTDVVSCTAPTISTNPPNRTICANGSTTFIASATNATSYQWQVDQTGGGNYTDLTNGGVYSNVTTGTLNITGATSGMNGYRYRAVAINGTASCFTNTNYGTLTVSSISGTTVVTNVACNGGNTGAINLTPTGGVGPYTFNWNSGAATTEDRTGLVAGSYSVVITDAIGCTGTVSGIIVTQPPVLNGSTVVTNVACFGNSTGAINLTPSGGTPPYTYNWNSGAATTEDRTGLPAGSSYSVVITDANGCTRTLTGITITQPAAVVSGTTVVTNVACFGGNTGAINLTPTGGVGPYTFNWGGGVTTEDRTILTAGTYSVTITDANGCTGTVSGIAVTQPSAAVSGTTVVTNVACFGGNTGAINLTPTGGVGPYTFNWGGGITSEDRTGLTAGTYSVTITDANGCTGTVSPTVTQPSAAVSGTTVVTNVACFGGNTGAINLTPTGGVGPYTFNWNSGVATSEDRTNLTSGTYSVTITDANGCTGTVNATVTQPAAAVSGTTVVTNVACFGGNTGAINLTPTGGVGPYTFNWVGGATTEDRILLTAGTYSVTITDANGCTGTVSGITVTQPTAAVSGTTVVTNVACFGGNTGAINLTPTGGVGPYTFNWGGGVTSEDRILLTSGTYSVTITDANGCTGTVSGITVTQPAAAVSGTTVVTNIACFGGNTGAINLTPTGGVGPYTFNWGGGVTSEDRTGLTAGTYTVTITDANGCTGTVSPTVTQPAAVLGGTPTTTSVSCFGGSNGTATITPSGGTPGYTYLWSNGATTQSTTGLMAGTYSVTITDANACTRTINNIVVGQPAAVLGGTPTTTSVSCFGGSNGTATITPSGGTPGYTYLWSNGATTPAATGLLAGTYSVTITDANSCSRTINNIVVGQPAAVLGGTPTTTSVSCFGGGNGTATITPSGGTPGYTYLWSNGATTQTATGLLAGNYSVTITDANSCSRTINNIAVTQPNALTVTPLSQTNIACFGGSTGSASISAGGGTPGYTYDWSPGTPTGDGTTAVTGLSVGTYTVTVTDANGCTTSQSFTITQPAVALTATAGTKNNVSCFGGANGSATVSVSGGTPSYTYSWSPSGGTAATASGLTAGSYTVTVTDANGCTTTQNFTITEPNTVALASATLADINVSAPYSRTFVATGGTGSFTYVISAGSLPAGISLSSAGVLSGTPSASGTFNFTITATDGLCSQTVSNAYTLKVNSVSQTITFNPLVNRNFGDAPVTLAAVSSAGLPVTYVSSNQNVATINGNILTIAGAGTTNITASQAGNGTYLPATNVSQMLSVLPKSITGVFTVANKDYDGTTAADIQNRSLIGVTVADQSDVSLIGGMATFASAAVGNGKVVNQTGMTLSGSKAGNYNLQGVSPTTGDITPKQLTVTADSKVKTYGDADPILTYVTNGLVGADVLTGSLSRSAGNDVGVYPITANGLNAGGNYLINFVGAGLTINKKLLNVTAENKSRIFGVANPVLTITYAGFVNGETSAVLNTLATANTAATINSPAGSYPIVVSGATATNYSFNYINGTLVVTSNSQTISFAALADKLSTDAIFTLNATSSAGLTISYTSSDPSIARIVNGNQVEILKAGTVNITASQSGNANYAAANPVIQSLKINDNPAPIITIASSLGTSFNKGETSVLTATGATSYVWSNGNGIIGSLNTNKISIRPTANAVYTVTGSNQFGRTSTQTIAITVVDNLSVVEVAAGDNMMTPNGDGVNDYFVVKNIDLYPNNNITIYDRLGKILYKMKSYKNDWDGSINGNPLEQGTYYYLIDFGDGKTTAKKGFITIVKN